MYRVAVIVLVGLFSVSALAANRVPKFDTDNDLHVNYVEITAKCQLSRQLFDLADKEKISEFRQSLRDITEQANPFNIEYPTLDISSVTLPDLLRS